MKKTSMRNWVVKWWRGDRIDRRDGVTMLDFCYIHIPKGGIVVHEHQYLDAQILQLIQKKWNTSLL